MIEEHSDFSEDKRHRYRLWKQWGESESNVCCFCLFNPLTGDSFAKDPTLVRCEQFARSWGCDGVMVVCLFSLATAFMKDIQLEGASKHNDEVVVQEMKKAKIAVAAWGAFAEAIERGRGMMSRLKLEGVNVMCLQVVGGFVRTPLVVDPGTNPIPYEGAKA